MTYESLHLPDKHKRVLDNAVVKLKESVLAPYIRHLILYGSCSRNEEKESSDVDLFMEFDENLKGKKEFRIPLRLLYSTLDYSECLDHYETGIPEVDVKYVFGDEWRHSDMTYYKEVRKDGIELWH